VLLPGLQKGRAIKASQGKGQVAVLPKKGQFVSHKENLEKPTEFLTQSFSTFKILQGGSLMELVS
jgi:hypothetical protein